MKWRCNLRNWTGLVGLACLLLVCEFAKAADRCLNVRPSFTYTPVVSVGGRSTLGISVQAGCFWEVLSLPEWIKILSLNRGYGSGSVVFLVLPNKTDVLPPGFIRLVIHDLNSRQSTTLDLPIRVLRNEDSFAARTVIAR
jgi:hypothetical protein